MYLFNKDNIIQKYKNADKIMEEYYEIRLKYYGLRKQKMIEILENIVDELKNKVRFIRMVKSKQIDILDTTDEKLENDLVKNNFKKLLNSSNELSFNYLTTMHIRSLTLERANKLEKECNLRIEELKELKLKNIKNMWLEDLKDILIENQKYNKNLAKELLLEKNDIKKKIKKKRNKKR
jgi:DNA topoisomerase-2